MLQFKTQEGYLINIPNSFHVYDVVQYLGYGSTCVVLLVEDHESHQVFAAKVMAKKDIENRNLTKSIFNEVNVLQSISHPHIIKIHDFLELTNQVNEEYYAMITEYCENGDLLQYALKHGFKSEIEKKKIMKGFLEAISYLHNHGISHGDIKSENILLDGNLSPKLCDFGFCKSTNFAGEESKNGTLYYAAPELFIKGQFDPFKADIYAIGITLYSLSELHFPFIDGDQNFIIRQIIDGCLSFKSGINNLLFKLVKKCTNLSFQLRPSIEDIIHDEYFTIENNYTRKINNFSAKDFLMQDLSILDF